MKENKKNKGKMERNQERDKITQKDYKESKRKEGKMKKEKKVEVDRRCKERGKRK